MKGAINKERLVVHIVQALIWATAWIVMLWIDDYQLNEWVGVAALGYLAWYVSHAIVDSAMRFALARVYQHAVIVYGKPNNEPTSVSKRAELIIASLASLFIYGVGFITSGFMFILTWLGLIAFGFPPLDMNIRLIGLVSVALGSIMVLPTLAVIIYMLSLGKNRVSIRERFTQVSALAWSLITKERFMPKWGFGLNSQYIERSTV